MFMCYLDESGVPESAGTTHFVLIGIAIPDTHWKRYETDVNSVKQPFGLINSEIHTAWMARRYLEQESVSDFESLSWEDRRSSVENKRKARLLQVAAHGTKKQLKDAKLNYRKSHAYTHLTLAERMQVLQRIADLVGGWQDARLFAEIADKQHVYANGDPPTSVFEHAFTEVTQRFEYFLRNRGNFIGQTLYGMIVQDNNETVAKKLTGIMRRFHQIGTRHTNIDHIIETPLFVDSQLTSMVQVADLCGYATRRYFENAESDLFDRIYPRFDRTNRGVVGARHNTAIGCTCNICRDHS